MMARKKAKKSDDDLLNLPKDEGVAMRASIWRRIAAVIIDLFLVYGLGSAVLSLLPITKQIQSDIPKNATFLQLQDHFLSNPDLVQWSTAMTILFSALFLLYFSIAEFKFGQTVGKNILNIRIEAIAGKLSLGKCMVRSLWSVVFVPVYLLWIIDIMYMFFNKDQQRLLEKLSKTRTIQKVRIT